MTASSRFARVCFVALAVGSLATTQVAAQSVKTAVSPDTIRVGDPFRAVVRIDLPNGTEIALPDSLTPTEDVENAGRVRIRRDTANGAVRVVAAYPLTAWRPGPLELPMVMATVSGVGGRQEMAIALPNIDVASVLPADTAGIEPKPPKDVLGGNRLWWPWLLALAALLALAGALYWWYRKRRKAPGEIILPLVMPRERALEELDRIAKAGLIEQKDFKRYYTLVSEVLRRYMQTIEGEWSTTLTTDELHKRVRSIEQTRPAVAVLRQADMVKFARSIPDDVTAARDLERVRAFVTEYPAAVTDAAAAAAEGEAA
jgi:hypothetical protein